MSSFSDANALFRAGSYQEALERYTELYRSNPDFSPYRFGLMNTLKRLMMNEQEIDAYMLLNNHDAKLVKYEEAIHPESLTKIEGREKTFVVVTPVLNGEKFIDQTIESVITQKGNFFIEYLIKDGGSNDNTVSILERWCQRIRLGEVPLTCNGLRFRFQSSRDNGLYDAVAQGFSLCPGSPYDVLSYINSDDVFISGAFEIVEMLFNEIGAVRWICGQINVIDESGQILVKPKFPLTYAREDISIGLHDGRSLYFIQQEGTFWTRELYDLVGGINPNLKLAGDFDLWRRFASHSELLALNINLASFRSRPGQLSSQLDKYYIEVDSLTNEPDVSVLHEITGKSKDVQFLLGKKAFPASKLQHPGPICFLTEDMRIYEIAYLNRTWIEW